ncbi:hypothetical protein ACPOL_3711 [Acidisarcina polymorpha]|uniref:Uncharacterized protein n=1 Tax=Acidisarcina polymorpha TaxID=2211140 RepID=A0A2Z5G1P8_9BACT|nr:hypothetical protein ACPOL_3711 [Acidisarcina polymorpha]
MKWWYVFLKVCFSATAMSIVVGLQLATVERMLGLTFEFGDCLMQMKI